MRKKKGLYQGKLARLADISNNTLINNSAGIHISNSDNNTFLTNKIIDNRFLGINLGSNHDNIYKNNLFI